MAKKKNADSISVLYLVNKSKGVFDEEHRVRICTIWWSCIATVAILYIGAYRGSFKKQMTWMMVWVAVYAAVYFFFIDKIYAAVQLFAALSIPLLKSYNGERGSWNGMKWLFYIYYPAHLIACGIIRLLLHGNISIMIGG